MTDKQADLLNRFAWLCDEIRAGNQFSDNTLLRWAAEARQELDRDWDLARPSRANRKKVLT